ncbi:hypothetical protein F5883DRAFT_55732 [Diaporthe sp. PMI_573]|nr:hypothetical protein F5883DRAFT_55732 [Diaporthaceae sp. PMI_573]
MFPDLSLQLLLPRRDGWKKCCYWLFAGALSILQFLYTQLDVCVTAILSSSTPLVSYLSRLNQEVPPWETKNPSMDNREHLQRLIQNASQPPLKQIFLSVGKDVLIAAFSITAGLLAAKVSSWAESGQRLTPVIGTSMSSVIYPHMERIVDHLAKSFLPVQMDEM